MELNPTPIPVVHHPHERFDSMKSNHVEVSNKGQPQYEKKRFVFHLQRFCCQSWNLGYSIDAIF
jgi:hypothetical protein